jgi:hypothetical protein
MQAWYLLIIDYILNTLKAILDTYSFWEPNNLFLAVLMHLLTISQYKASLANTTDTMSSGLRSSMIF